MDEQQQADQAPADERLAAQDVILGFLEVYDADMGAERRGEEHQFRSHNEGAAALLQRLRDTGHVAPEDAPGTITLSHEELVQFAFQLAGAASVPFMRDNPTYIMPAEELGALVREVVCELFGFDAAELEGYGIRARGWISKAQAQLLIGVLEEETPPGLLDREDIATAIGALRDVSGLNGARDTHDNHEGLAQARQTQPEADRG